MRVPAKRSAFNIQEKLKNTDKKCTVSPDAPTETKINFLAHLLTSRRPGTCAAVLQVLVGRMRHPEKPYTSKELEVLLLLSQALVRAGMWPV